MWTLVCSVICGAVSVWSVLLLNFVNSAVKIYCDVCFVDWSRFVCCMQILSDPLRFINSMVLRCLRVKMCASRGCMFGLPLGTPVNALSDAHRDEVRRPKSGRERYDSCVRCG